jgi:hypothetical protein
MWRWILACYLSYRPARLFFRHSIIPALIYKGLYVSTTCNVEVRVYSFFTVNSVDLRVDFPPPAGCWHECVSPSTTSRVLTWGCIPFHHQQGVDMRVYPFPPPAGCWHEVVSLSTNSRVWMYRGVSLFTFNKVLNVRVYPFSPPADFNVTLYPLRQWAVLFYYRKTYALICNWACKPGFCIRRRSGTHVIPTLAWSK